jgi:hypothetical protein
MFVSNPNIEILFGDVGNKSSFLYASKSKEDKKSSLHFLCKSLQNHFFNIRFKNKISTLEEFTIMFFNRILDLNGMPLNLCAVFICF